MSANNLVWCMSYKGSWHVFYSGCADIDPKEPDYKDQYYGVFGYRNSALLYAHDILNKINKESYKAGFAGVEYGVCEITIKDKGVFTQEQIEGIDKRIDEWEQKIKDLQFSVEQFKNWKFELLKGQQNV